MSITISSTSFIGRHYYPHPPGLLSDPLYSLILDRENVPTRGQSEGRAVSSSSPGYKDTRLWMVEMGWERKQEAWVAFVFCKCPDRERLVTSDRSEVIRQKTEVISTCGSANMTVLPWDNPDFLALGLAAWATDTGHRHYDGCDISGCFRMNEQARMKVSDIDLKKLNAKLKAVGYGQSGYDRG